MEYWVVRITPLHHSITPPLRLTSSRPRASWSRRGRTGPAKVSAEGIAAALTSEQRRQREALVSELDRQRETLKVIPTLPMAYAANSRQPEPTFVLFRGDVESKGAPVTAGGLSAVQSPSPDWGLPADAPEGLRRLKLAQWIASPENPLTARVIVNRVWQAHFGRGIVPTPSDFGLRGDSPTHPELLDWLATAFTAPETGKRGDQAVAAKASRPPTRPAC